jgi:predicted RNase H-like nuclease
MTTTTFIGVDLAWQSTRNPTGIAVLEGDRESAKLTSLSTIYPERSVAEAITANATANTIVAIDAPLIITNETGQRTCETAIGKRYGSREASCHTTNLRLYPDAASIALTTKLASRGFVHPDRLSPEVGGRIMAEVYPHAAMVALWDLPKTIKYKKGSAAERRLGLNTLRKHLFRLRRSEPALRRGPLSIDLLSADLNQLNGQKLKDYEDQLDALFCAYLAYYFWYWGWERNEMFGDLESGYILNPNLASDP